MNRKKVTLHIDGLLKEDKKQAKMLEKIINKQWEEYRGIISAILGVKNYIETVYPFIKLPSSIFDRILEKVIERDIDKFKKNDTPKDIHKTKGKYEAENATSAGHFFTKGRLKK